jgi:hypothetical protein
LWVVVWPLNEEARSEGAAGVGLLVVTEGAMAPISPDALDGAPLSFAVGLRVSCTVPGISVVSKTISIRRLRFRPASVALLATGLVAP